MIASISWQWFAIENKVRGFHPKRHLISAFVLSAVALVSCGEKFKSNDAEAMLRNNGFSATKSQE